ncbi:MAG: hypothetical protein R6X02_18815 [Enhygromyxa sp.]
MNRSDVLALQAHRGYPLVSVIAPTHRTSPDNKADPILVRNLIDDAKQRLLEEKSKREAAPVFDRLAELVEEVDWAHTLDGLALFASPDHAELFYLPHPVRPRVVIDETFATRDLVATLARSGRYRVLVLSEKPTRLYDGARETLEEHVGDGFPRVHQGPGGATALPGGAGINPASVRQEAHMEFFRQIDAALGQLLADDPTPVVVVGVQRYLGYYNKLTSHGDRIIATVEGSHDKTPAPELGKLVWPRVEEQLRAAAQARIAELDAAEGAGRLASGVAQAWRAAAEGRGAHLIVEQDYHVPGTLDSDGLTLTLVDDATAPGVIDDVVDELIELVIAKGGEVTIVEGGLDKHQRVALMLRY